MDLKEFLKALPAAATSPLAFVAYLATLLTWAVIALQHRRISTIMRNIRAIPERDRKTLLETEMGIKLPKEVSAEAWLRARRQTYLFWAFLVLILAIVAIVALAVFSGTAPLTYLGMSPLPSPVFTPTAFAPASGDETLIVVTDFEDRSGGKYGGIDPAQYIYEQLGAQARENGLPVRIERLRQIVDDNTVYPAVETYNATLALWGWYDSLTITPRLERIKPLQGGSDQEGLRFSLSNVSSVEFTVVTDLPSQSAYLVLFTLGLDRYTIGQLDEALNYLNSALDVTSKSTVSINPSEAYEYRGAIYFSKKDYDRAIADLTQVLQLRPKYASVYSNRAAIYATRGNKGDFELAIADAAQAISLQPDFINAYINRGMTYDFLHDYDHALADANQTVLLAPNLSDAYAFRARIHIDMGEFDLAIADCDKAIKLEPNNVHAYNNRASAYNGKGKFDLALADANKAIQLNPNQAEAYSNRGAAYFGKSEFNNALVDANQAILLKPNFAPAYVNRGFAYGALHDDDQAIADFTTAIQIQPDNALAYFGRGAIYASRAVSSSNEDKGKAIADLERVLELSQDANLRQLAQTLLQSLREK